MKLLNKEGYELDVLDLGIVKAGETKEYQYILYNNLPNKVVDINIEIDNNDVKILSYPLDMNQDSKEILSISWTPAVNVEKALKANIKITEWKLIE